MRPRLALTDEESPSDTEAAQVDTLVEIMRAPPDLAERPRVALAQSRGDVALASALHDAPFSCAPFLRLALLNRDGRIATLLYAPTNRTPSPAHPVLEPTFCRFVRPCSSVTIS